MLSEYSYVLLLIKLMKLNEKLMFASQILLFTSLKGPFFQSNFPLLENPLSNGIIKTFFFVFSQITHEQDEIIRTISYGRVGHSFQHSWGYHVRYMMNAFGTKFGWLLCFTCCIALSDKYRREKTSLWISIHFVVVSQSKY